MELKPGYKLTEVGAIPDDWNAVTLETMTTHIGDGLHGTPIYSANGEYFFINGNNLDSGKVVITRETKSVDKSEFIKHQKPLGDRSILLSINGTVGNVGYFDGEQVILGKSIAYLNIIHQISKPFIYFSLQTEVARRQFFDGLTGSTIGNLGLTTIRQAHISLPPTKAEQEAIAETLSDADALIDSLEQLITKKRHLKQGAMQELLTGKRRLPGFSDKWVVRQLVEIADCLDNLRVPLNDAQRNCMRGDIPYCGANGILDYVSSYVVNDDIILMAEDGGYFDEYAYRPIAYRVNGKCWVNNHAHILKAKQSFDQRFLFYSLVHKNILNYLASGTRAKLNKSEMNKIELLAPVLTSEQTAIAAILSDMDTEIATLETKLAKARQIKQGMMQELLTGRIRLVNGSTGQTANGGHHAG